MSGVRELKEFNFLIGDNLSDRDEPIFDGETVMRLPSDTTFPDILMIAGVFQSKSLARKNGWGDKEVASFNVGNVKGAFHVIGKPGFFIPIGWTDFWTGKGKTIRISILKMDVDTNE